MEIKNIREALKQGAQFLEDNLKDGIINQGLLKTGDLARSVKVEYKDGEEQQAYNITMEEYGYYQDTGVKGTQGWNYSANEQSVFQPGQFKSKVIGGTLPFAVKKSIAQKGFRPRPFIMNAVERTDENMQKLLADAGMEDIDIEITKIYKQEGATVK